VLRNAIARLESETRRPERYRFVPAASLLNNYRQFGGDCQINIRKAENGDLSGFYLFGVR